MKAGEKFHREVSSKRSSQRCQRRGGIARVVAPSSKR